MLLNNVKKWNYIKGKKLCHRHGIGESVKSRKLIIKVRSRHPHTNDGDYLFASKYTKNETKKNWHKQRKKEKNDEKTEK